MNKHLTACLLSFVIAGYNTKVVLTSDDCGTAFAFLAGLFLMAGIYEMGFYLVDTADSLEQE